MFRANSKPSSGVAAYRILKVSNRIKNSHGSIESVLKFLVISVVNEVIVNFKFILLSSSSSCFSFIFASDIFVLTSLQQLPKILAQIQRIRYNFYTIFIILLTFSVLYVTTPDDGFELAETCRDIRV
jgi:hypothetical protein